MFEKVEQALPNTPVPDSRPGTSVEVPRGAGGGGAVRAQGQGRVPVRSGNPPGCKAGDWTAVAWPLVSALSDFSTAV